MIRLLLTLAVTLAIPTPVSAGGALTVQDFEMKVITGSDRGTIHTCGIHFSVVALGFEGEVFGIQGSVNNHLLRQTVPTTSFKLTVVVPASGEIRRTTLQHAFVRTSTLTTTDFAGTNGDYGSWLAWKRPEDDFLKVFNLPIELTDGFFGGFSFEGSDSDYTFVIQADPTFRATRMQQAECVLHMIDPLVNPQ